MHMHTQLMQSLLYCLCAVLVTVATPAKAADGDTILDQRCKSCHDLTGPAPQSLQELWNRKGPDLFYAGNKYKAEWLEEWLEEPRRIRPAGMFYGNHIKSTDDGDVIDESTLTSHPALPEDQAEAVAAALMKRKAKSDLVNTGEYEPGSISLMMGELMFDKFKGCLGCHQIEPGYGGLSGPEVYTAAERLQEDYIISYMRNPQAWDPMIFMPQRHLRDKDLQKLVHYFRALGEEDFDE